MEPKETKYCVYCGEKISTDAERCVHCGEWLNDGAVSRNHISYTYTSRKDMDEENNDLGHTYNKRVEDNSTTPSNNYSNDNVYNRGSGTEYSKILPIRRFFLLLILTGGLYSIYWIYKTNCHIRDDLGKDVSPGWRTFFFILIPIANIIVFYMTLNDMNKFIKQERIETYSPGLNTVIPIFSNILFGLLGTPLVFWVYFNVQESINEFWRIKEPNLPIRREFSGSEIVVMIVGVIFLFLIFVLFMFLLIYME